MLFIVLNDSNVTITKKLKLKVNALEDTTYYLKGIVYHGNFHFNSRIISSEKLVWFHDGRTTGRNCTKENHLSDCDSNALMKRTNYKACLLVYSK